MLLSVSRRVILLVSTVNGLMTTLQEVDVGLAADIGTLSTIPKVTGNQSLVRELAFSARNFSALEAEKLGLLSNIVDGSKDEVVSAALELAKVIAAKSPYAVAATKQLLLHSRDHSYVKIRHQITGLR